MELRENNIININLSDIQEMVSECFRKISLLCEERFKWTKELCHNEAKKYNSRSEFQKKSQSAYLASIRNKWIDDYDWFKEKPKHNYWDYKTCKKEAKKYNSRREFQRKSGGAYKVAWKNGWLDSYDWFQKRAEGKYSYIVYCYKDEETNSVYVGLTNNMKQRHRHHKIGVIKKDKRVFDIVYKYFNSIGKEVPDPIVLKENLSAKDAQHYEGYYVEFFKNEGMNVLNISKTGSLGGYSRKWTEDACNHEAKKYTSMGEFRKNSLSAYETAWKNGWLKDYTWLIDNRVKKSR